MNSLVMLGPYFHELLQELFKFAIKKIQLNSHASVWPL